VPFYGQGLNCGLEDVRILDQLLREQHVNATGDFQSEDMRLSCALSKYTETRYEDLIAICDLAMKNYTEMRHDVATWSFLLRKAVDNLLYGLWGEKAANVARIGPFTSPRGWLPLYTMVTFRPDIGYATAKRRAKRQTMIISGIGWSFGAVGLISVVAGSWIWWQRWRRI